MFAVGVLALAGCVVNDPADGSATAELLELPTTVPSSPAASDVVEPPAPTSSPTTTTTEPELDVASAAEASSEVLAGRGNPVSVSDAPAPPTTSVLPDPPAVLGDGSAGAGVPQSEHRSTPSGGSSGGGSQSNGGSPSGGSSPSPSPTPAPTSPAAPAPATTQPPPPPATQPPPPPPPTAAPAPQASFGSCTVLDPSPVNNWRAGLGLPPLGSSSSLASASCAWSLEMAKARSLTHGAANEVIHYSSQSGGAFSAWRNSSAHYNLLVTTDERVTQIGCGMVRADYPDGATLYWSTCRMNW